MPTINIKPGTKDMFDVIWQLFFGRQNADKILNDFMEVYLSQDDRNEKLKEFQKKKELNQ